MCLEAKRILYSALCDKLEQYHSILDPCGFRYFDNGRCWNGIPCCHSGGACEYLSDSGCSTHSLSCLLWLCRKSLDYLDQIASNPLDSLHFQVKSYLNIRPRLIQLAETYIPLKQRASEDDTFINLNEDPMFERVSDWYDDWGGIPWEPF